MTRAWGVLRLPKEKILIVEDERIVAEEIRYMLSSTGYTVTGIVSTGPDAIRMAGETLPDFILMDIRLKGTMDGIEAAGIILERHNIPVIYLTAYSDEATIHRARLTRPLGFIIKPLDRIQVNSVIEVALYRYRREKILIESERWLSATLKTIDNGIIATGNAGDIHYMNPSACLLAGVSAARANGKPIDEIVSIVDIHTHDKLQGFFNHIFSETPAGPTKGSAILVSGDGYEIPVNYVISPVKDENRQGPGFIVILHDISRRLKIENVLHNNEKIHRSFTEAAGEGVMSLDATHRVQFMNPKMAEMLGLPKEHVIGQPIFRFLNQEGARDLQFKLSGADCSPVIKCEVEMRKSDATGLWAILTINKMTDKDGNYAGAVAMVSDISGRKAVENRLTEAKAQTELYLELIEKEIGKMNQIFLGYLDTADELTD